MVILNFISEMEKKYKVNLEFLPIDRNGYLLNDGNQTPTIVVNSSLPEGQVKSTVLHEIGHLLNDPDVVGNYTDGGPAHYHSERGANNFMVRESVKEYVSMGNEAGKANWLNIATYLGTNNYSEVKQELAKHIIKMRYNK